MSWGRSTAALLIVLAGRLSADARPHATSQPPRQRTGGWRLSVRGLLADARFGEPEPYVAVADPDGDGRPEIVAVSRTGRARAWRWNGRRFAALHGLRRLHNWDALGRSLCAGDLDGDGKEEIYLLSDFWGDDRSEVRAYGWRRGRWRLRLHQVLRTGLMGADNVEHLLGVLRAPAAGRFLVASSHNIEDANKNLLFYHWRGGRMERASYVGMGTLMRAPFGSAIVHRDGRTADELLLVTGGALYAPTASHPSYAPLSLQRYTWSEGMSQFVRGRGTTRFPSALKQLVGAVTLRGQTLLIAVEGSRAVLCHSDGEAFRMRPPGVRVRGKPAACGDLFGDGDRELVSVDGAWLRVSPRLLRRKRLQRVRRSAPGHGPGDPSGRSTSAVSSRKTRKPRAW